MLRWAGVKLAESALARAEQLFAVGHYDAATKQFNRVRRFGGAAVFISVRALIGLGRVALAQHRVGDAVQWFRAAREVSPSEWEATYWEGCSLEHAGRFDEADVLFTQALTQRGNEPRIRLQRGLTRFQRSDYEGAFLDLTFAPSDAIGSSAWLALGAALERTGSLEHALAAYERTGGGVQAAIVHSKLGNYQMAWRALRPLARKGEVRDLVMMHYGWSALKTGHLDECIQSWTDLAKRCPNESGLSFALDRVLYNRGLELARQERYREAIHLWEECRDRGSAAPDANAFAELYFHAAAELLCRRPAAPLEARAALERALFAVPDDYRFAFHLGLLLAEENLWDAAQCMFQTALHHAPGHPEVIRALVLAAAQTGDVRVLENLRKLTRQDDSSQSGGIVDQALALIYLQRNQPARVLAIIRDSKSLRTDHPKIAACALFGVQQLGEFPDDEASPPIAIYRALTAAGAGRAEEALALLGGRVGEERPADQTIARLDAYLHAQTGKFEVAAARLSCAGLLHSTPATAVADALLMVLGDRPLRATSILVEALQANPTDHRALHTLAVAAYHAAGKGNLKAEERDRLWKHAIAAWVALVHLAPFWAHVLKRASRLIDRENAGEAVAMLRRRAEHNISQLLDEAMRRVDTPVSVQCLLDLEVSAANLLKDVGGLQLSPAALLVAGPLFFRLLGLTKSVVDFFATLDARTIGFSDIPEMRHNASVETPRASDEARNLRRLRHYFSSLGRAQLHLERGHPQEAIEALSDIWCGRCPAFNLPHTPVESTPSVCGSSCAEFDTRNPSYGYGENKAVALAASAVQLAIQAHLQLAVDGIAAADAQPLEPAVGQWRAALTLAGGIGAVARVERSIVDAVLGRCRTLERKGQLERAQQLVDVALPLCRGPVAQELAGRAAELLTNRGVAAANQERWEEALVLLRRAVQENPHAFRPLLQLALVCHATASQHLQVKLFPEAQQLLDQCLNIVRTGQEQFPGRREFDEVCLAIQTTYNNYAVKLANEGDFDSAIGLLSAAVERFPEDANAHANRNQIYVGYVSQLVNISRYHDAQRILVQAVRDCAADPKTSDQLKNFERILSLLETA